MICHIALYSWDPNDEVKDFEDDAQQHDDDYTDNRLEKGQTMESFNSSEANTKRAQSGGTGLPEQQTTEL